MKYYYPTSITSQECVDRYDKHFVQNFGDAFHEDFICAENPTGRALCYGDEGNPVVKDGILVGIVTDGCYCGWKIPGVFTKVYSYIDWIKDEMNK